MILAFRQWVTREQQDECEKLFNGLSSGLGCIFAGNVQIFNCFRRSKVYAFGYFKEQRRIQSVESTLGTFNQNCWEMDIFRAKCVPISGSCLSSAWLFTEAQIPMNELREKTSNQMRDVGECKFSQHCSRDRVIVKRRARGLSDLVARDEGGILTAEHVLRRARHLSNKGVRNDPGSTKKRFAVGFRSAEQDAKMAMTIIRISNRFLVLTSASSGARSTNSPAKLQFLVASAARGSNTSLADTKDCTKNRSMRLLSPRRSIP